MATADRQLEENKRIARRVPEELATEGNIDLVDELYAQDAVEHDPFGDHTGRSEIRESFEPFLTAFPDVEAVVDAIIAEDDLVAMLVTIRGTHEGPFVGIEPTGKSFQIRNLVLTRVEGGEIAERWIQPDVLGMMQQLGVDPSELPR